MPVPQVYILKFEFCINAFVAGYTPNDAVLGVTQGAIDKLTRDELQALVGHEFSHIFNGDMRLNMRMTALLISGTTKASTSPFTLWAHDTILEMSTPLGVFISARTANSPDSNRF